MLPRTPGKTRPDAPRRAMTTPANRRFYFLLGAIACLTIALYLQTIQFDFVSYDDGVYVVENEQVRAGLTARGFVYAATTGNTGTWQPLTLLSHMLDVSLFGMWAGGHHLVNALLHAASALLLGLALFRLTKLGWPSAVVAAVFAVHPAHVESVAWVSERKDVLSAFFLMLFLLAYAKRRDSGRRIYTFFTMLFLALGLLAKPMLVTAPFLLLLLDYWPLQRVREPRRFESYWPLIYEKLPLFAMVLAACVSTLVVQHGAQATSALSALPMSMRIENAIEAYVRYIGMSVWPRDLIMYYPHPRGATPALYTTAALLLLVSITGLALFAGRRAGYLAVGWFWYVGTLVPVIGLVQVGTQAIADRYTYIPMIGLAIMVAFGTYDLATRFGGRAARLALHAGWMAVIAALSYAAWHQIGVWRNSETLYRHTISVMPENPVANMGLGLLLVDDAFYEAAIPHLNVALNGKHRESDAHYHLGIAYQGMGDHEKALESYQHAVAKDAGNSKSWNNLGVTLDTLNRPAEAEAAFVRAVENDGANHEARYNLGVLLIKLGRAEEAEGLALTSIGLHPERADAHLLHALALVAQGSVAKAVAPAREAVRLDPGNTIAKQLLETIESQVEPTAP